jgi:3-mercaptopropionate dioxygenase
MTTQAVHGLDDLIACLDEAVGGRDSEEICEKVQHTLERMLRAGSLELPAELTTPREDRYARRLLHRSPVHGYTVIAMTWGPGQGTPLHDHAGMWCVEGVLCGNIDVTQYDLVEQRDERCRFRAERTIAAGVGSAGSLIPPFEYHTIANSSATDKAVTVHVYAGEMTSSTCFLPASDGWFDRQQRQLSYCD